MPILFLKTRKKTIAHLNLYGNAINDQQMIEIINAIVNNPALGLRQLSINDNDFGLGVKLSNTTETDPTALTVDNNGVMTPAEANKTVGYQLVKGKVEERATQLWIIKTKTELSKM